MRHLRRRRHRPARQLQLHRPRPHLHTAHLLRLRRERPPMTNTNTAKPWTAGELRAALEGVPDDTPIVVNTDDPKYDDMVEEWAIYSAGYGRVDWGDGYGLERDQAFGLNCHFADEVRVKPNRPRKDTR
jgi:hypothetical protein